MREAYFHYFDKDGVCLHCGRHARTLRGAAGAAMGGEFQRQTHEFRPPTLREGRAQTVTAYLQFDPWAASDVGPSMRRVPPAARAPSRGARSRQAPSAESGGRRRR